MECRNASELFRIVRGGGNQHADSPHPVALLRARCQRPHSRTAKPCDEFPPPHRVMPPAASSAAYPGRGCMGTGYAKDCSGFRDRNKGPFAAVHKSVVGPTRKRSVALQQIAVRPRGHQVHTMRGPKVGTGT